MTFTISQSELNKALGLCSKAINGGLVIATGSYRFKRTADLLEVSACNMEFSISKTIPVDSKDFFDILIPADKMSTIGKLADQPLIFTLEETKKGEDIFYDISIKSNSGSYKFQGYYGGDFPVIKTEDDGDVLEMPFEDLTEAIYKTSFARLLDSTANRLNALSLEFAKSELVCVGASAGRVSVFHVPGSFGSKSVLLPVNFTNMLAAQKLAGICKLTFSQSAMAISIGDLVIKGLLMDEQYVDWKGVIPKQDAYVTIIRSDVLSALKRVLDFANKDKTVSVHIGDELTISASDKQVNQNAEETLKLDVAGNDVTIFMNGDFLSDALSHFSCETLLMYFDVPSKPVIFKESLDDPNISLVAPQVF